MSPARRFGSFPCSRAEGKYLLHAILLVLLLIAWPGTAQQTTAGAPLVRAWQFDWPSGTLAIELSADVAPAADPTAPFRAQRRLDEAMPSAVRTLLQGVSVDSRRTIGDAILVDPTIADRLDAIAREADRRVPRPSPDLATVSRTYVIPVYPEVTRLFVGHEFPFPPERVIRWVPTDTFSGVVIYAAEELTWHGTGTSALLVPALLPEIFDTNLRPVVQVDMVEPDIVRTRGVVAYTDDPDETRWRGRIGVNPLRIMARRVFGVTPTDLMIAPEDADRLLSTDHNRRLLSQGRILVIVAPQSTIVGRN